MSSRCSVIVKKLIVKKMSNINIGSLSDKQIEIYISDIIENNKSIRILVDCSRGPNESYKQVKERFGKK